MNAQTAPFGPVVQKMLRHAGIPAAQVERRQKEAVYTVSFFNPEMQTPTRPSGEWAQEITSKFSGITIINRSDTYAPWRVGKPVLEAMVQFRGIPVVVDIGSRDAEGGLCHAEAWRSEFNTFMMLG